MPAQPDFFKRELGAKGGLVVALCIAAVVGLCVLVYPAYARARTMARLRAAIPRLCKEVGGQRQVLASAIDNYKKALGFYPPDHLVGENPPIIDAATNQLLYELVGSIYNPTNDVFYSLDFPQIRAGDAKRFFNASRFKNSAEDPRKIGHFLKGSEIGATVAITERPDTVALLSYWPNWEGVEPELYRQIEVGTWCYNSSAPVHNRGRYDLWIEINTPLTNIVIANW